MLWEQKKILRIVYFFKNIDLVWPFQQSSNICFKNSFLEESFFRIICFLNNQIWNLSLGDSRLFVNQILNEIFSDQVGDMQMWSITCRSSLFTSKSWFDRCWRRVRHLLINLSMRILFYFSDWFSLWNINCSLNTKVFLILFM